MNGLLGSADGLHLVPMEKEAFDAFYKTMVSSFVREERRDEADARRQLENPLFTVYSIVDGRQTVGYVTVWQTRGFAFLEHFFMREEYRNRGYGARTMTIVQEAFGDLVLEAEPPEDSEIAARRVAFYERLGFHQNHAPYLQPSYHGDEPVPLVLMSYPSPRKELAETVDQIYSVVYGITKG